MFKLGNRLRHLTLVAHQCLLILTYGMELSQVSSPKSRRRLLLVQCAHRRHKCRYFPPESLLPGVRHDPQVGLGSIPAIGIFLLRVLVGHCRDDDHILAGFPVHRGGYLMLGGELDRIKHP